MVAVLGYTGADRGVNVRLIKCKTMKRAAQKKPSSTTWINSD